MKILVRAASLFALLLLVDGVIFAVLTWNLRSGVFPINADSIGIPLTESFAISAVAGVLLISCLAAGGLSHRFTPTQAWRWFQACALALTHLAAAAFFGLWGWSWATPHHYLIFLACVLAAAAILYSAAVELRALRPNNSSKPTPLRGAA